MKINTALILCAGYGKRLNPLTLTKPKPLIEVNNITLLENTINLIKKLNNVDFKIGQFPMRALGRSRASSDLDGFVKINGKIIIIKK